MQIHPSSEDRLLLTRLSIPHISEFFVCVFVRASAASHDHDLGETGEAGQKQENTNTWNERTLQKHKETSAYFFHGEGECDNARSHDIVRDVHDGPSNGRPRVGFMFAVVRNEEFLHFLTSERSTNMHLYFSRPAKRLLRIRRYRRKWVQTKQRQRKNWTANRRIPSSETFSLATITSS